METNDKNHAQQAQETDDNTTGNSAGSNQQNEAIEDDGTPVLDEEDLEENDLDEEEADDVEWEDPKGK